MSQGTIIDRSGPRGPAWLLKYDTGKDANGKRKIAYATVKGTKKEARAKLRELLSQVDKGMHVDRSDLTVRDWMEKRLAAWKVSPKTRERYSELVRYITDRIGDSKLQHLKADRIEQLYDELERTGGKGGAPLSARTVHHVHRRLFHALKDARRFDVIVTNPFDKVDRKTGVPKPNGSPAIHFEEDELTTLLERMRRDGDWLLPIASLDVKSGLRRGEILALRWGAVDFDAGTIDVRETLEETRAQGVAFKDHPKSDTSRRTILLPHSAVTELRAHRTASAERFLKLGKALNAQALVFSADEDPWTPRKPRSVSDAFAGRLRTYRLKRKGLSLHSLRHTFASILLSKGVNIKLVSTMLGHSDAAITLRTYAHVMKDDQRQAIKAMDEFFSAAAS